ncbi:MAG: hypothetical protein QOC63_4076 [Mycobacterium sp.]|jgi:hypothetical protein|nr:hypothetical protein [Mycobacterium sp.]
MHHRRVENRPVEGTDKWPLSGIRCPASGGVSPPAGERHYWLAAAMTLRMISRPGLTEPMAT